MGTAGAASVSEVSPSEAWDAISQAPDAVLVDVRTKPEWSFVGIPDLSDLRRSVVLTEWRRFPDMTVSETFAEDLIADLDGTVPQSLFFICRSGVRSMEAANRVASYLTEQDQSARCINVAEGFEGDLNQEGHRGTVNGWKVRGLKWRQS